MRNYEREITNGESRGVEFPGEAAARGSSRTSLLSDGYTRLQLTRADISDSDMAKWPIRHVRRIPSVETVMRCGRASCEITNDGSRAVEPRVGRVGRARSSI
jgi:hypothetical protein